MTTQKRNPAGRGRGSQKATHKKPYCNADTTTVSVGSEGPESPQAGTDQHHSMKQPAQVRTAIEGACLAAIANEISIVLLAADRLASGYGLPWRAYDRLHQAHQILLTVLAAVRGEEVLQ